MATSRQNDYPMTDIAPNAYLRINTSKLNGYIKSVASVYAKGNDFETHAIGMGSGGDYYQPIDSVDKRATQKAMDTLHNNSIAVYLDEVKQLARDHYVKYPWSHKNV